MQASGDAGSDGRSDGSAIDSPPFTGMRQAYLKESAPSANSNLGSRLALSADGTRLAATAFGRAGSTGGVVVYARVADLWSEETFLLGDNTATGDQFGRAVAMSDDGATLAIGANLEDSGVPGINVVPDESQMNSGAVYVFTRTGTSWTQQAYIKPSQVAGPDDFGTSVSIAADGNTLVVGAFNAGAGAGAAWVFNRSGTTWSEAAQLVASNSEPGDRFGEEVAISGDGMTIAVSAPLEDSIATGIDGNEADNGAVEAGAVYTFLRTGATTWTQNAYVKASNTGLSDGTGSYDQFGWSVSLSASGDTLAVGARLEDSGAAGVDADQQDMTGDGSGAAYVFTRVGNSWAQQAYIKAPNVTLNDFCGEGVRLSADGNALVMSAPFEDGSATGLDGVVDEGAANSGAVWRLTRAGTQWSHRTYLKATNTDGGDNISGLAISADGATIALGAHLEDSDGSSQTDESVMDSGAVYAYW